MTSITTKNEVLIVKSLQQPILQEIKESSKSEIMDSPSGIFGIRGMSEGARPFPLNIFDTKISVKLNFWRMHQVFSVVVATQQLLMYVRPCVTNM